MIARIIGGGCLLCALFGLYVAFAAADASIARMELRSQEDFLADPRGINTREAGL